jgi:hypothetical protein
MALFIPDRLRNRDPRTLHAARCTLERIPQHAAHLSVMVRDVIVRGQARPTVVS